MLCRLLCIFVLLFCGPAFAAGPGPAPLRVHAWVGYFPAWLVEGYTRETGVPVLLTFFADNKALYRSIIEEGALRRYDVITPSAEMVQQLGEEGHLLELDKTLIPAMSDVDPWFFEQPYDKGGTYSAPLFWGVLGMLLDLKVLPEEVAARVTGYKDLWLPELRRQVMLPYDFRSLMSIMLLRLGYSVNDAAPEHLEEAMDALESLAPAVRAFNTVDQGEAMLRRTTGVGVVWSRKDYAEGPAASEFRFVFPSEGSPLWVDAIAVPAGAPSPEAAFRFIDYVLRPDNLARLCEETGYAVAGRKAVAMLPESLRNNAVVFPPASVRKGFESEMMLPPAAAPLERRWNKIKNGL